MKAIGVAVIAIAVGFALWNPGDGDALATVAASVGVALLAIMALGSLYVAVLGRSAVARWIMRAALLCLAASIAAQDILGESATLALGAPGMAGLIVGAAWWWVEGRELRRLAPAFALAARDAPAGSVLVFHGPVRDEETGEPRCNENEGPLVATMEVLPNSRFVYGDHSWELAELREVADLPSESPDAWLSEDLVGVQEANAGFVFRERALTQNELGELERVRRRHLRRAPAEVLGVAFVTANVARGIEWIAGKPLGPELTASAWIVVGVVSLWRLVSHGRAWRQLGDDLDRGVVVRVWDRSSQTIEEDPFEEFLPATSASWSQGGRPAAWRT